MLSLVTTNTASLNIKLPPNALDNVLPGIVIVSPGSYPVPPDVITAELKIN